MSIADKYRRLEAKKLGRDLVPGDVLLEDGMPRRVLHVSPSFRTGTVLIRVRTEWGSEFSDTVGLNTLIKVMP